MYHKHKHFKTSRLAQSCMFSAMGGRGSGRRFSPRCCPSLSVGSLQDQPGLTQLPAAKHTLPHVSHLPLQSTGFAFVAYQASWMLCPSPLLLTPNSILFQTSSLSSPSVVRPWPLKQGDRVLTCSMACWNPSAWSLCSHLWKSEGMRSSITQCFFEPQLTVQHQTRLKPPVPKQPRGVRDQAREGGQQDLLERTCWSWGHWGGSSNFREIKKALCPLESMQGWSEGHGFILLCRQALH